MKELIPQYDINKIQLCEGDIVAEGKIGETIWDGQGIIKKRPLGVVVVYDDHSELETSLYYNVCMLCNGIAELTESDGKHLINAADSQKLIEFSLSHHDHIFRGWDDIEKIGSVYDLDKTDKE